ncbi:MAG: DUF3486 family protein [Azospirillaceae bacterium]|nr:DUF3486 family protein [Azospirillaceae bacterium]
MAKQSSLKSLPPKVLDQVNKMIGAGGWTFDDLVEYLAEAGHPRSRSSIARYGKNYGAVAAKLREGREVTAMLVEEMGPQAAEGRQGRLLVEILRRVASDRLMQQLADGGQDADTKDLMMLARMLKDMSAAARYDQDFETKAREYAARWLDKAVDEAKGEVEKRALSPLEALERVRAIYRGET